MALARVVSFDSVGQDRVEEMKSQMNEGRPDDIPASEIVMLYDAGGGKGGFFRGRSKSDQFATGGA